MKKIIMPISIDFGAKHTGVYYASYEDGAYLKDIQKEGEVLTWGKYTSLLKKRTIHRHTRRNYQRRKLAKRLFVLILENYFNFPAKKHAQAIGFFINRRGFNRLEKDFSKELIDECPEEVRKEVMKIMPEQSKKSPLWDYLDCLTNENKIKEVWEPIENKIKEARKKVTYSDSLRIIERAIRTKLEGEPIKDNKKLSKIPREIIKQAIQDRVGFKQDQGSDILSLINNASKEELKKIQQLLPKDIEKNYKRYKRNQWNFNLSSFDVDNVIKKEGFSQSNKDFKKNHLHHLCFAIHKINEEVNSGSRHRKAFFEEIKKDLDHLGQCQLKYLQRFNTEISTCQSINVGKIYHLIAHISNFELKPLRAYFNDEKHKKTDKWEPEKLSYIFEKWILKQWRVGSSDGSDKEENYKRLKEMWKNLNGQNNIISFWLQTDPTLTIPPYQDIKNRRPPKCQTLLLNQEYLEEKYPEWKKWSLLLEDQRITRYGNKLAEVKGQKNQLIDHNEISVRKFQLVLDTSKNQDQYKMNKIWSIYHQIYGSDKNPSENSHKKNYEEEIKKSNLPEELKIDLFHGMKEKFKEGSFGHFLNKYYKTRKKTCETERIASQSNLYPPSEKNF